MDTLFSLGLEYVLEFGVQHHKLGGDFRPLL
jgi:hypothetical protein